MSDTTESNPGVEASEPVKKRRGNPNFQKGKSNEYYTKKDETMSDETTNTTSDSANPGEKKHIPQDIFSDEIPQKPILPLEGELKTKDYAAIQDGGTQQQAGNTNYVKSTTAETTSGNIMGAPSPDNMYMNNPPPGVNPGMGMGPQQQMPGEDPRTKAEQAVKLMLRGYEKIHGIGRSLAKINEQELMAMHESGKVNLNYELPLGRKVVRAREFFADYNQTIDDTIVVEEKFKDEITPPLTRIAIKHNIGLSDEMFVAGLLAEDLGTKVSLIFGLKKSTNLVLDALIQIAKGQQASKPAESGQPPAPKPEYNMDPNDNGNWREAPVVEDAKIVG